MTFQQINWPPSVPTILPLPSPSKFAINATPNTDIWRCPPSADAFSAPILYQTLKLSSFRRARVFITADWRTLFDQGGLCLILPQKNGPRKWIKTGIEVFNGTPHIGTVACDRFGDWSLVPMKGGSVTVEMEREIKDGRGTSSLWIYAIDSDGQERRPLREIAWVFEEVDGEEDRDCWVGVYAAKPTRDEDDGERELRVEFTDFVIESV